jgi:hypothetical protein
MKKNYDVCDGILKDKSICPLKEKCARFFEEIDKAKMFHLAWGPYNKEKQKCGLFEPYEEWEA